MKHAIGVALGIMGAFCAPFGFVAWSVRVSLEPSGWGQWVNPGSITVVASVVVLVIASRLIDWDSLPDDPQGDPPFWPM